MAECHCQTWRGSGERQRDCKVCVGRCLWLSPTEVWRWDGAEKISHVSILKSEKFIDLCHRVLVDAPVSLCDQFGCNQVCIYREADEASKLTPKRTVASVLMEPSCEVVLPQPISPPEGKTPHADQRLHNVSGESHRILPHSCGRGSSPARVRSH